MGNLSERHHCCMGAEPTDLRRLTGKFVGSSDTETQQPYNQRLSAARQEQLKATGEDFG